MVNYLPRKRFKKLVQFLFQGLLTTSLLAALALGAYGLPYLLLRDSGTVVKELPITLPESHVVGVLGEKVINEPLSIRVNSVRRIPSDSLGWDVRLGARARPERYIDYLILELSITNRTGEPATFDYAGQSQHVDLLIGSIEPMPDASIPAVPREAELITRETPLPSELAPNGTAEGIVVFPIDQASEDLSLLILPSSRFRGDAAATPSFKITLDEP